MDDQHQCPWCGASDFVEAKHMPYQNVAAKNAVIGITGRANLCYTVCRNCGTVVRTYVDDLDKVRRWR